MSSLRYTASLKPNRRQAEDLRDLAWVTLAALGIFILPHLANWLQ